MSVHISAKPGDIAPIVLMPGDPLRAKFIAENNLDNIRLVNSVRNIFFFTGTYKGMPVTIGASGMGCPSIGIYSYELYDEFGVECIIRIGTCGAYRESIDLFTVINTEIAFSESTYAKAAFNFPEDHFYFQGKAFEIINDTAVKMDIPILTGSVHSSDAFYRVDRNLPAIVTKNNCLAAEMESFSLFANAKHFKKTAATLLTVSDNIITKEKISAEDREKSLVVMSRLSLDTAMAMN